MELIERILDEGNLMSAMQKVISNRGKPGIDGMTVKAMKGYFIEHMDEIISSIREMKYQPQPVRRVYIPKANGKKRPLGIPTTIDRVVQQAIAQQLAVIYEPLFSEHSYAFRVNRDCHGAIKEALMYINEGYDWLIDLDIEKYFDTVNHDKLISILREQVNDRKTLHLIRSFLRAGAMENGVVISTELGVPQGGPLSVVLSNIYLDKFDKELENRGLRFVRYADDVIIMVKSKKAAKRVMESVKWWLERKLFLKVSATKTKVVRPNDSQFLGFKFYGYAGHWKCAPAEDRKAKLRNKIKPLLKRSSPVPIGARFERINQVVRGWINYYCLGDMKTFMKEFGSWLRHKVRVVILKQWKKSKTIYRNLQKINRKMKPPFTDEEIYKVANSSLGWYRRSGGYVVNFLLSPKVLGKGKAHIRPGLINPLNYYLTQRNKLNTI